MTKQRKIKVWDMFEADFLTSGLFIKTLSLIGLFAVFFTFYTITRYKIESTIKQISDTTEEIKNLQNKASEQRSMWQKTTLMLEISQKLEVIDVKIPTEPIKQRIILKKHKYE